MTNDKPIKCASYEFTKSPFYVIQSNGNDRRFIASFPDVQKIKQFLTLFIEQTLDEIQIKIADYDDANRPLEYEGQSSKSELQTTLEKYEDVVFHDGFHDLMLRRPETGDYIAFDDHGLVFIYTEDDYTNILEALGLIHKPDELLIYEYNHWHYRPPNGRKDLKDLINELGLV